MKKTWLYLIMGGLLESIWVMGLKHANSPLTIVVTICALFISFYCLFKLTNDLPTGSAYAGFVGLGTAFTTLNGMIFFQEPFSFRILFFISLLLVGVIGLEKSDTKEEIS